MALTIWRGLGNDRAAAVAEVGMLTWGCIVLVASFAEGQQTLGPLQLLEVLIEFLQHTKSVGWCAYCKRKCKMISMHLCQIYGMCRT